MRKLWSPTILIVALLLAAGCSSSGTTGATAPGGGSNGPTRTAPHTTVPVSPPQKPTHSGPSVPGSPAAHAHIAAAIQQAKASGKRVLVDFGAGWCVDCKVLDKIFERPAVAPTVEKNFVVVHVDVHDFNFNMDISKTYGNACKGGIPALVVLDDAGKMLVNTHDGSFEHARAFGNSDVLEFLNRWKS